MDKETMLGNLIETYAEKYAEQHHCTVDEAKQSAMYRNYVQYVEKEYGNKQ